jgi:hypothetical protein
MPDSPDAGPRTWNLQRFLQKLSFPYPKDVSLLLPFAMLEKPEIFSKPSRIS